MGAKTTHEIDRKIIFFFVVAILFAMLINVFHPYLWGPDEPRVAQIAREAYVNNNYVTPYLCLKPFVEKPPLYFNMVACCYHLAGDSHAGVARLVSALLGCVMLATTFWLSYKWGGLRRAAFATALLITMPQFYRASHWIVIDIGVGAFAALALALCMYYLFWYKGKAKFLLLCLFYLAFAGAFLTKGLIGVFHILVVIGTFILIRRRWRLIWEIFASPAIVCFLLPAGIWLGLFYNEGGLLYLHEHFINNTIGRFLHIRMSLPGADFAASDVGNSSPWFFYFERLPVMFGGAIVFIPFIIWNSLKMLNWLPVKWVKYAEDIKGKFSSKKEKILTFLLRIINGNKDDKTDSQQQDIILFLLIWAFLPLLLLSFSSIKEVTYILPSYVALAIMGAGWLDDKIKESKEFNYGLLCFSCIVIPCGIASITLVHISVPVFIISVSVWMGLNLILLLLSVVKLRIYQAAFVICGIVLCGVILGNTPEVMRRTGLNRKCYIDMAKYVFKKIGNHKLYVFGGGETVRGSIPFYGKRNIAAVFCFKKLIALLTSKEPSYVIMFTRTYKHFIADKKNAAKIAACKIIPVPYTKLDEDYVLLASTAVHKATH